MSLPPISRREAQAACEETRPFRRLVEKRLPFDEIRRELRGAVITEHADGKGLDIHDPTPERRHMLRLYEMQSEYRALDYELGQESVARTFPEHERETLKGADGTLERLPGPLAEQAARKRGMRPLIRWGRASQPDEHGLWANGHTHLGEPWPWVRESCPGCGRG